MTCSLGSAVAAGTVRRGGSGPGVGRRAARGTAGSGAPGRRRRHRRAAGPSERHVDDAASSAMPGSWNQRTARPYRFVWSIVCGAPTSRSSAGRSAVSTSIGTPDRPASTTAGCRLAAAVPLVHSTIAGVPAEPETEGDEAGGALVVDDVHGELGAIGEGEQHRRAARTGGDDGVAHAPGDQLVGQRRAERRLGLGSRRVTIRPVG